MNNNVSVNDLLLEEELEQILLIESTRLNLSIFKFIGEELKKYHNPANESIGVMLLAKDNDNARYNLANLRRCYLYRTKDTVLEHTTPEGLE